MKTHFEAITDQQWAEKVDKAEGLVAVKFWSPGCTACSAMAPTYNVFAADYDKHIATYAVNTETDRFNYERHKPPGTPALLFFYNGVPIGEIIGNIMVDSFFQNELSKILEKYAALSRTARIFRRS